MDMFWDRTGSHGPASGQLGPCIRYWEWVSWPIYIATGRQDQQEAIHSRRVLHDLGDLGVENLMGSGLIASE
jgi:hypothetical protein